MREQSIRSATIEIRVPFCDLDPLDVVWHGNHVKYFEQARSALLDGIGFNYPEMKASGYSWPVIELFVRYAHPLRFGQRIHVRADLVECESRLRIVYRITDAQTGKRLVKGHTVQVAVEMATGFMSLRSPDALLHKLGIEAP